MQPAEKAARGEQRGEQAVAGCHGWGGRGTSAERDILVK